MEKFLKSLPKHKFWTIAAHLSYAFSNFTKKIIKPLESVGQDVYDNACATIAEELESLSVIEYGKQASLRSKEERLINSLVELRAIDLENYNSKFLNELSILTKRS